MHIEARVFIYRLFLLPLIVFPPPNLAQGPRLKPFRFPRAHLLTGPPGAADASQQERENSSRSA